MFDCIYDFDMYEYTFIPRQNCCRINVVQNDTVVPLPHWLFIGK